MKNEFLFIPAPPPNDGNKGYHCHVCDKQIKGTRYNWHDHWKRMHIKKPLNDQFSCCLQTFATEYKLRKHILKEHVDDRDRPDSNESAEVSKCIWNINQSTLCSTSVTTKFSKNDIKLLQIDRQTNVFIKDHPDEQETKGGGTNEMEDQEEKPETDQQLVTEATELKLENEMVN